MRDRRLIFTLESLGAGSKEEDGSVSRLLARWQLAQEIGFGLAFWIELVS